jgi:hypothetical protein
MSELIRGDLIRQEATNRDVPHDLGVLGVFDREPKVDLLRFM